jgi:solute carrier family 6 (neurotransmitter transporter, GABA) member 1
VIAMFNEGSCFAAAIVIFSILGFMAKKQGTSVENVIDAGTGLAFVAYPTAILELPWSPLWSVLFFLMLFFAVLDSQFCTIEGFIVTLTDEWPKYLRNNKTKFTAIMCLISYAIGISMVTQNGIYIFNIFDTYAVSGQLLLTIVFFEAVSVSWFYGRIKLIKK